MGERPVYKKDVYIDFGGLSNILCSSIESYSKEVFGLVGGEERKKGIIIMTAPPLLSAERHRNFVDYNKYPEKYRRAKELIDALQLKLLGCYHSHPRSLAFLSTDDIKSALDEVKTLETDWWLEIVIGLEKKSYKRSYSGAFCMDDEKTDSIKGHIKIGRVGWAFEIRGQWIERVELPEEGSWPNRKPANLRFNQNSYPSTWRDVD